MPEAIRAALAYRGWFVFIARMVACGRSLVQGSRQCDGLAGNLWRDRDADAQAITGIFHQA